MQDFKKFIIQVQTFVIADNIAAANEDSSLMELREFALTDVLSLPSEQVLQQVKRLESIYQTFLDFWINYKTIPVELKERSMREFFYCLDLDEYFKIVQENTSPKPTVTENYVQNILYVIGKRQTVLHDFIRAIQEATSTNKVEKDVKVEAITSPNSVEKSIIAEAIISQPINTIPVFKSEITEDLFALLKDYFVPNDQSELIALLQNTATISNKLLVFHGNGNQLADAFKQLFDANLIVGSNKAQLIQWIQQHFSYQDKNSQRNYTEKYLNDIISTDTKNCQSPILDVKKKESGDYGIVATQRIKKNYKKY